MAQQQRAIETRQRLIESTIACLVERGYAGASTTVVARHAGVSQGALFKHFAAKPLLLAAAIEWVFGELRTAYEAGSARHRGAAGDDRLRQDVEALCAVFRDPRLHAVFEVFLATRTDGPLRELLQPIVQAHFEAIGELARRRFPGAAVDADRFDAVIRSVLMVMQGSALMTQLLPEAESFGLELDVIARILRAELERVAGDSGETER